MPEKFSFRPYLVRLVIVLAISLVFTLAFNEVTYLIQKENYDRAPRTVQIVIPAGTARQVEAGQDPPSIPSEMSFVLGDVLEVKNEDNVSHQLGPIWVPPGTTGSLVMEQPNKYAFHCSFQTSQYLGIDVHPPTTLLTRLTALSIATPTLGALLYLYGLLVFPINKPGKDPVEGKALKKAG